MIGVGTSIPGRTTLLLIDCEAVTYLESAFYSGRLVADIYERVERSPLLPFLPQRSVTRNMARRNTMMTIDDRGTLTLFSEAHAYRDLKFV